MHPVSRHKSIQPGTFEVQPQFGREFPLRDSYQFTERANGVVFSPSGSLEHSVVIYGPVNVLVGRMRGWLAAHSVRVDALYKVLYFCTH